VLHRPIETASYIRTYRVLTEVGDHFQVRRQSAVTLVEFSTSELLVDKLESLIVTLFYRVPKVYAQVIRAII
jgi:hypothetical protein